MFLTKYFFLIALVAAVAATFALVAPRPVVQKLRYSRGSDSIAPSTPPSRCSRWTRTSRWIASASSVAT